ncbi:hypothetical protein AVEN_108465-1 [Araneus ventricosus]|uniref:Uncharacterized protein n=1 Tax=Araneus ventricosus TaxID=182803 RepID=A0A4Y2JA95_ARAVE|nr:hypothetical protein AVEN_108465-1 [Araneus ventricosus]
MALMHEFFSTVIELYGSIGLYASKLSRIIEQLRELGYLVEALDQCFQLLRYLPTEYENIVQTVYRGEDKDFKFPKGDVIELLPEKDGVTRLVRLGTYKGELLRSEQRIFPLEVSSSWFKDCQKETKHENANNEVSSETSSNVTAPVTLKLDL